MPQRTAYIRATVGLCLGAVAAFIAGCGCEYYLWNPPSNDWGNEKTTSTILLVVAAVPILVLALILRRALRRLFRLTRRIGRSGLIGMAVGAVVLPAVQLSLVIEPWRHHTANLEQQRGAMIAGLDAIRERLSRADAIVVYLPPLSAGDELDRFFRRLSRLAGKPVYRLGIASGNRWIMTRYRDAPEAVIEAAAFPPTGLLLSFVPDLPVLFAVNKRRDDEIGRDYYSIALTSLERRPDDPGKPPYRFDDQPVPIWRNCGFVVPAGTSPDGPMPFGRLVQWDECALLLDSSELEDRLLGTEMSLTRPSSL